jgi:hypothetical protein
MHDARGDPLLCRDNENIALPRHGNMWISINLKLSDWSRVLGRLLASYKHNKEFVGFVLVGSRNQRVHFSVLLPSVLIHRIQEFDGTGFDDISQMKTSSNKNKGGLE